LYGAALLWYDSCEVIIYCEQNVVAKQGIDTYAIVFDIVFLGGKHMSDNEQMLQFFAGNPLAKELRNTVDRLFIFTGHQNNVDMQNYSTLLLDFEHVVENSNPFILHSLINQALDDAKPVILLNVHNGEHLSKMLGIGFKGKCMIVRRYNNYDELEVSAPVFIPGKCNPTAPTQRLLPVWSKHSYATKYG
jgi:hypothetical protein